MDSKLPPLEHRMLELITRLEKATELLRKLEWGFQGRRCLLCGGWDCSPNGETDFKHTKDCQLGAFLEEA